MESAEPAQSSSIGRQLVAAYASVDPRALGLFRVAFGALLLVDLLRRWPDISLFYSNDGVLSNHFNAFHPPTRPMFSVLTAFSSPSEVKVAFACFAVVFLLHMIGAYTRVTRVLVPVLCASLVARNPFVANAGMSVMTLVAIWTAFLPLGARFSVDAVRASLRDEPEASLEQMGEPVRSRAPVASIAALGVLVELVAIYGLNAAQKSGGTWQSGEALHDVLWQDRLVTGLGAWVRAHETPWLSPLLSTGTRVVEAAIAVLLLSPWRRELTRTAAVALIVSFHASSALLLALGPFPWVMMAASLLVLPRASLDRAARVLRSLSQPVTLSVEPRTPGQWLTIRALRRLDSLSMLRLEAGDGPVDGAALCRAVSALPFGRCLSPLFPVFAPATLRLADRFAASGPPPHRPPPVSPLGEQLAGTLAAARESFAGVFLVTALLQTSQENWVVPAALRVPVPEQLAPLAGYAGIRRGWNMFAPDAPRRDGALVIDAKTLDGRRIDPFSGRPPADDPLNAGPALLGQLRCDYALKISFDSNAPYREELRRWLGTWRGAEGRLTDRLVSYEVSWVSWDTPPLGQPRSGPVERRVLLASPVPRQ